MTDDQIRELLQSLRDEPVPPDSLVRVRQRVEERTSGKAAGRGAFFRWVLLSAAAFACVVIAIVSTSSRRTSPDLALRPAPQPTAPAGTTASVPPLLVSPKPVPQLARNSAKPVRKQRTGNTLIKIETPDPDVVLFFVAGGDGE